MDSDDQALHVLSDPVVKDALAFLNSSLKTCSEVNSTFTLDLCASYLCAFMMRVLLNQGILSSDYLANELQYFGSKFIIDFSTRTAESGGDVE